MKSRVAKTAGLVLALAACVGMTVFAEPSPSASTAITGASAVDANGNTAEVIVSELPEEYADAAAAIQTEETLREVMGDDFNENMVVVDVVDVTTEGDVAFPLDITFEVAGVTSSTNAQVLHYVDEQWQKEPTTVGEGTVTATFESLSPVAIVIDRTTLASGAGVTSPQTSAVSVSAVALVGIAAAAAAVILKKKAFV
ncbi:hypothetical protein K280104A7_18790 [Candidatus Bariatricus faecipullorum]